MQQHLRIKTNFVEKAKQNSRCCLIDAKRKKRKNFLKQTKTNKLEKETYIGSDYIRNISLE